MGMGFFLTDHRLVLSYLRQLKKRPIGGCDCDQLKQASIVIILAPNHPSELHIQNLVYHLYLNEYCMTYIAS